MKQSNRKLRTLVGAAMLSAVACSERAYPVRAFLPSAERR